jgi:hypothetical protein
MAKESKVIKTYKSPKAGQSLISVISSNCRTPILEIKYSNLINPFYYPNSPKIPRYSITCLIDPDKNGDFISNLRSIEKNEGVESVIKVDSAKNGDKYENTGKLSIKFQGKDQIPIYVMEEGKPSEIKLEDEFAKGEKVMVVYDILRYTKKNTASTTEHGLSFKPTEIYFYPAE